METCSLMKLNKKANCLLAGRCLGYMMNMSGRSVYDEVQVNKFEHVR